MKTAGKSCNYDLMEFTVIAEFPKKPGVRAKEIQMIAREKQKTGLLHRKPDMHCIYYQICACRQYVFLYE